MPTPTAWALIHTEGFRIGVVIGVTEEKLHQVFVCKTDPKKCLCHISDLNEVGIRQIEEEERLATL